MRKVNNSKTGVSKGPVINKVSVGPEDIVLGHDTFCIHFVGSLHTIIFICWVKTHFSLLSFFFSNLLGHSTFLYIKFLLGRNTFFTFPIFE